MAEQEGVGVSAELENITGGLGAPCGLGLAEPGEVGLGGVEGETRGLTGLQEGGLGIAEELGTGRGGYGGVAPIYLCDFLSSTRTRVGDGDAYGDVTAVLLYAEVLERETGVTQAIAEGGADGDFGGGEMAIAHGEALSVVLIIYVLLLIDGVVGVVIEGFVLSVEGETEVGEVGGAGVVGIGAGEGHREFAGGTDGAGEYVGNAASGFLSGLPCHKYGIGKGVPVGRAYGAADIEHHGHFLSLVMERVADFADECELLGLELVVAFEGAVVALAGSAPDGDDGSIALKGGEGEEGGQLRVES